MRDLSRQTYRNFHLVLIDDGSGDGTAEMVLGYVPDATILKGKGDWWWGGSLQQGVDWLRTREVPEDDIVLMINDDVAFKADFLQNAVNCMKRFPNVQLLARACTEPGFTVVERGVFADWRALTFNKVYEDSAVNCFSTRGLFMRAGPFLTVGGFRPVWLPHYLSDYEFSIRAGRKGYGFKTDDSVFLLMNEAATGYHASISAGSLRLFLKRIFSKKAAMNPVYFTNFILLACPLKYIPLNLLRVWRGFFVALISNMQNTTGKTV